MHNQLSKRLFNTDNHFELLRKNEEFLKISFFIDLWQKKPVNLYYSFFFKKKYQTWLKIFNWIYTMEISIDNFFLWILKNTSIGIWQVLYTGRKKLRHPKYGS